MICGFAISAATAPPPPLLQQEEKIKCFNLSFQLDFNPNLEVSTKSFVFSLSPNATLLELSLLMPLPKVTHSAAMIDTVCTIHIRKKGGSVLFFFSIAMTEQEEPAGRRQDDKKDPVGKKRS